MTGAAKRGGEESLGYIHGMDEIVDADDFSTVIAHDLVHFLGVEGLSVVDANWCRPSLANMILRIEFWDEASTYAESEMKIGDYYFLGNARMKMDAGGYIEGTISELNKFRKLDADELENSPHLTDLLRSVHRVFIYVGR